MACTPMLSFCLIHPPSSVQDFKPNGDALYPETKTILFLVITAEYEKEYGKDTLELPKLVNEEYIGKNFYIVDDIYATGNTMKAIKQAIEKIGGIIKGEGVIMNIKELNNDSHIYSLLDINEE